MEVELEVKAKGFSGYSINEVLTELAKFVKENEIYANYIEDIGGFHYDSESGACWISIYYK